MGDTECRIWRGFCLIRWSRSCKDLTSWFCLPYFLGPTWYLHIGLCSPVSLVWEVDFWLPIHAEFPVLGLWGSPCRNQRWMELWNALTFLEQSSEGISREQFVLSSVVNSIAVNNRYRVCPHRSIVFFMRSHVWWGSTKPSYLGLRAYLEWFDAVIHSRGIADNVSQETDTAYSVRSPWGTYWTNPLNLSLKTMPVWSSLELCTSTFQVFFLPHHFERFTTWVVFVFAIRCF